MKPVLLAIVLGTILVSAGAAIACDNPSICGSGWQDRGSHGRGGSGYGYGSGYASARAGAYSTSNVSNTNKVSQSLSNQNTQTQGQGQTQTQSISNSGNSSLSNAGNSNVSNAGNNTVAVSYVNNQKQQPVATAYAAPLVAGVDTCMGSTSVGGQGITIGFSFASTWTDKNCVRLKNSRELNAMGMTDVACQLLAMDREVADALRRSGRACDFVQVVEAPAPPPPPPPPPVVCCEAPRQLPAYEQERGDAYTRPAPYGERG